MIDLSSRWVVLAFLFVIGITAPFQFQSVAALAPFLIADAGLTYTDIGVLTGLYMLPGIVLAGPCGPLAARFGDRLTLVAGIALMAISGVAFALTDNYAVMFASRLIGGAGAVALTVLLPKVVTDRFVGREIATALAIIAASVGFGIGIAMAVLPAIAAATSWRIATLVTAGVSGLGIVLLLAIYRDAEPRVGQMSGATMLWRIDRPEAVLSSIAGIARGLFSAGYAVFMSFLPPLLIGQGMAPVEAGLLTSVAALASLVSVPAGGYLSDRTGRPNAFIVGGAASAALACFLVPYVAPAVLWIVTFGVLRGGCTGGIMALPSRVLRPESRTTGFAISSAAYFVCMAAFPAIAGYLLDATGSTAAPLWFAGMLWLAIIAMLAVFLALERRWITARG